MSKMLTFDEAVSISNNLTLPNNAFIDGKFSSAFSGDVFTTVNPANERVLTEIASCDFEDVNYAVEKARVAFQKGVWSKKHPSGRKECLIKLCKLIKRNLRELAVLESLESGKPILDCITIDLPETINCIAWHAEAVDKIYDQISPSGDGAVGMIVREPAGVVGCVLPWNFPLMMLAWKIGPALASGNSVIVKPAEQTSMTALKIADLAIEAGIPAGVLNILPGFGEKAGKAIGLHPDIDVVSFTGSTEIGREFLKYSAESNLKRITLECGGKNPSVVFRDAKRLDKIAKEITFSVFWNMGQNCTANSRLIVHKDLEGPLTERIIDHLKDWRTGNPLDAKNSLGAIVSEEHQLKITNSIDAAKSGGASVIAGGEDVSEESGFYVSPIVFGDVRASMDIAKNEIFGPVLCILTAGSDEEALSMANETQFGLQASIYTENVANAHHYARSIKAGTVSVNCYSEGDITTPFGGYKLSGFGGKDNSLQAHDQYTETKTIWINIDSNHIDEEIN